MEKRYSITETEDGEFTIEDLERLCFFIADAIRKEEANFGESNVSKMWTETWRKLYEFLWGDKE